MRDLDVVIVGAGLAGLAAARELAGVDYAVLESAPRVGGRLVSEPRGEYWLNVGAHVFGASDSHVGKLIDAFGLRALPPRGSVTALAFKGKVLANGRTETYPFALQLSTRDRVGLIKLGLRIRKYAKQYLATAKPRPGEDEWAAGRRAQSFLNDSSFAEFLGPLSPDLDSIFRAVSNRAGGQPEDIAAGHGLAAFAMTLSKEPVLARTIVGGSSTLTDQMAEPIREQIELNASVTSIVVTDDGDVRVDYQQAGSENTVRARAAIVTTPAYVTKDIVGDLPADTAAALKAIKYGPSVVMAILTSERGPMPWDDIYALTVPGSSFNMLFNIAHAIRGPHGAERVPGGSLMIYGTGEPGRRLLEKSDDEVTELFLTDLHRLFPETQGIIAETRIQRWPAAAPYSFPGRGALQSALEKRVDPIYLAGDYLGTAFTETSVMSAQVAATRASERVLSGVRLS